MKHILRAEEMNRLGTEDYKLSEKLPLTMVLDNIRSLHNVGAVFRTADAFRIRQIMLCGITACPPREEAGRKLNAEELNARIQLRKTALGAEETVEWKHFETAVEAIRRLQEEGCKVYAVEQVRESILLQNFQWEQNRPIALVMGNEVHGVSPEAVEACDGVIEIPQFGTKHSLNVSVTAGIVMWEIAKKMGFAEQR